MRQLVKCKPCKAKGFFPGTKKDRRRWHRCEQCNGHGFVWREEAQKVEPAYDPEDAGKVT